MAAEFAHQGLMPNALMQMPMTFGINRTSADSERVRFTKKTSDAPGESEKKLSATAKIMGDIRNSDLIVAELKKSSVPAAKILKYMRMCRRANILIKIIEAFPEVDAFITAKENRDFCYRLKFNPECTDYAQRKLFVMYLIKRKIFPTYRSKIFNACLCDMKKAKDIAEGKVIVKSLEKSNPAEPRVDSTTNTTIKKTRNRRR